MSNCIIQCPLGFVRIEGDSNGISAVRISASPQDVSTTIPRELTACVNQINAYFSGQLKHFNLKLNPEGTPFQKKVWETLQSIPFGSTISYLELSKQLGNAMAIRAVANANSKNPLWVIIPCHRVIGSDGKLVGYAGGLDRKQWLIHHENPVKQQSLF